MRGSDCQCGHRLEGADDHDLSTSREPVDRDHAEMKAVKS
jgi:hypothetical protein